MKTNTNSRYAVAVLIDGDNASFEKMEDIMGFVSRYGDAIVRRIYGDWTKKALSAWKETAREHGFRLVQASSHAPGKNTTDIALVIDAMDILRDGRADCFCLVASDGDYSLAEAGPFHQFHTGTNRLRHPVAYAQGRKDILPGSLSQSRYTTDKSHSDIDNKRQFSFMHGKDA
jgi:hypothetical protein